MVTVEVGVADRPVDVDDDLHLPDRLIEVGGVLRGEDGRDVEPGGRFAGAVLDGPE